MAVKPTTAWSLGAAGLSLAVSAASWFLLIGPERAEAAATREQTVAAVQANAQLEVRIEQLRRDYADLPARQAELVALREALPEEPALAQLLRQVDEAAADAGITLDGLTSGAASAVVDPTAVAAAAAVPGGTDPGGTDPGAADPGAADEGATDPGAAAVGATPPAGADPLAPPAAAGAVLASIPLTIDTTAGFHESTLFLKALQTDISRALLVENFTITVLEGEQAQAPGTVRTTVAARVFVYVDPDSVDGLEAVDASTD